MSATAADLVASLKNVHASAIESVHEFQGETTVLVKKADLLAVLTYCRDTLKLDYFIDLTTIDNADREPRFELAIELASLETHVHLRIKSTTTEDDATFPTASALWPAANWHEREAYDMMGITFTDHPDLRRILMWEGYPYYPLRKEFPLAGKISHLPDVASTGIAPLQGGPFVTSPTDADTVAREPRAKSFDA
jgi:NADH-quinone oxidoreductase subunit C